jgi:hypothetical protein
MKIGVNFLFVMIQGRASLIGKKGEHNELLKKAHKLVYASIQLKKDSPLAFTPLELPSI